MRLASTLSNTRDHMHQHNQMNKLTHGHTKRRKNTTEVSGSRSTTTVCFPCAKLTPKSLQLFKSFFLFPRHLERDHEILSGEKKHKHTHTAQTQAHIDDTHTHAGGHRHTNKHNHDCSRNWFQDHVPLQVHIQMFTFSLRKKHIQTHARSENPWSFF